MIERVRYDGIARCSRPFAEGSATRLMFSQLGPGVVRGDSVEISGRVDEGAHLIVTEQTATRILGGVLPSQCRASWTVAAGAILDLRAEPVVAQAPGDHAIVTIIEAQPGATVIVRDVAAVANGARLRLKTLVCIDGRDAFYDAVDLGDDAPPAVGTFAVIGPTVDVAAFDACAAAATGVRIGIGTLRHGMFARAIGPSVWPVREALDALRTLAFGNHAVPAGGPIGENVSSGFWGTHPEWNLQ